VLLAAALIVAPLRLGGGPSAIGIVGAAAIIALAIALAAALLYRRHVSIAVLAAMALVFVATAGHFIVPRLDRLWLSRGAAALVARHQPPDGTMLAVVGYNEPSLVFLTGNRVKAQTADVPVAAGSEALVSSRDDAAFRQAIASQGLTAQRLDSVAGADYSNGQEMTLILYKIAPK
jgi:hypothetical protein